MAHKEPEKHKLSQERTISKPQSYEDEDIGIIRETLTSGATVRTLQLVRINEHHEGKVGGLSKDTEDAKGRVDTSELRNVLTEKKKTSLDGTIPETPEESR